MPSADALILERAEIDLEEGIAHAKEVARAHAPNRFLSGAMEAVVTGAVATLHLRTRFREDVAFLMELAHRVNGGDDPAALAAEHLGRVVHLKEMGLLAREKDPDFAPVLDLARGNFAKRLPDLARLVAVKAPASYEALVREAFPDRSEVDRIVDENRALTLRVVEHFERHPHLLRIPTAWAPVLARTAREVVEWQTERVRRGVEEIYAGP